MWNKYFWEKGGKIVGLYRWMDEKEHYFFEIIFDNKILVNIVMIDSKTWDNKWQLYFKDLVMLGITQTVDYDNLLWKF